MKSTPQFDRPLALPSARSRAKKKKSSPPLPTPHITQHGTRPSHGRSYSFLSIFLRPGILPQFVLSYLLSSRFGCLTAVIPTYLYFYGSSIVEYVIHEFIHSFKFQGPPPPLPLAATSMVKSYSMVGTTAPMNLRNMNMYCDVRGSLPPLQSESTMRFMVTACLQGCTDACGVPRCGCGSTVTVFCA